MAVEVGASYLHVVTPALAANDGPYLKFRAWAAQFYAEGVQYDRAVYPPHRPASPEPDADGVRKQTASARLKHEDVVRHDMTIPTA